MDDEIKETRINCGVKSCVHRSKDGFCDREDVHLQPCAHDVDNVVACSEFEE